MSTLLRSHPSLSVCGSCPPLRNLSAPANSAVPSRFFDRFGATLNVPHLGDQIDNLAPPFTVICLGA